MISYKVVVGKMTLNVTPEVNLFPHPHIQSIRNYAGLADDIKFYLIMFQLTSSPTQCR